MKVHELELITSEVPDSTNIRFMVCGNEVTVKTVVIRNDENKREITLLLEMIQRAG